MRLSSRTLGMGKEPCSRVAYDDSFSYLNIEIAIFRGLRAKVTLPSVFIVKDVLRQTILLI